MLPRQHHPKDGPREVVWLYIYFANFCGKQFTVASTSESFWAPWFQAWLKRSNHTFNFLEKILSSSYPLHGGGKTCSDIFTRRSRYIEGTFRYINSFCRLESGVKVCFLDWSFLGVLAIGYIYTTKIDFVFVIAYKCKMQLMKSCMYLLPEQLFMIGQ